MRRLHRHCGWTGHSVVHYGHWRHRHSRDHDPRRARHRRQPASNPAGVHRRAGGTVRLLPERRHSDRESVPRQEPARHRRRDSGGHVGCVVPLFCECADVARDQALCERSGAMTFGRSIPRPRLSQDARRALANAGFTRRSFLRGSGAVIVAFASTGVDLADVFAQGFNGTGSRQLDSWLAIGTDGIVTAYTGKCDFGQGLYTAQMQLVAEELCVAFDRVRLIQCDTSRTPDQGTTSGQQSHPTNFNRANLALAAATARETLVRLAATRLGTPAQDLVAKDGIISVKAAPSRSVTYGALIGGQKFNIQLDPKAVRKHPREWTVLGTPVPRVDMRAMATGQFEFVHNVRVPGMLHGRVVRPPTPGATVMGVDESSVRGMPGLVKVVVKNNFIGVVADKT